VADDDQRKDGFVTMHKCLAGGVDLSFLVISEVK